MTSWRIVNRPDIVTLLPPHVFGFCHMDTEQLLSSIGKVRSSVLCWHVLATYLSLLTGTSVDESALPRSTTRRSRKARLTRSIGYIDALKRRAGAST